MNVQITFPSFLSKWLLLPLLTISIASTVLAADTNPGIAPPNSNPLGASYARWGGS